MNIGDFIVNRKNLDAIDNYLSNANPSEIRKLKAQIEIGSVVLELLNESISSKSVAALNLSPSEMADFCLKIIVQVAAASCFQYGSRTNNFEIFLKAFKHHFQTTMNNAMGGSEDA